MFEGPSVNDLEKQGLNDLDASLLSYSYLVLNTLHLQAEVEAYNSHSLGGLGAQDSQEQHSSLSTEV